tara:strand:+ start:12525 stop:13901 length:1377 start_codon:yes stop_codon:yes gene_type:complete
MATFFIALFVLLMQFLWKNIDDLVGKGLEWMVILKLLFYVSASLVPMALPLAVLLSSLMTFGNLGEHFELVAFKSAGISLRRLLRPVAVLVFLLSIMAFLFSNYWLPYANLKSKSLLYDVREQKPTMDIQAGYFSNDLDGFTIKIKDKKVIDDLEHLYEVLIYDHTEDNGNRTVISAEEGVMVVTDDKRFIEFTLYNGERYTEEIEENSKKNFPHSRTKFKENLIRFDLSQFKLNRTDEDLFKNNYKMLTVKQLTKSIDTLQLDKTNSFNRFKKDFRKSFVFYQNVAEEGNRIKIAPISYSGFIDSLDKPQKQQIYTTTTNMCRNAKVRLKMMDEELTNRNRYIYRHQIEWHKKITFSVACIILFLIGAPLGAIIRKGGMGMPIVISILLFITFHMLSTAGEKMVKEGAWTADKGMWMATLVLLPFGLFLTYKATTDSSIFRMENYKLLFIRLFKKDK